MQIDFKTSKRQYDCRIEIQRDLGKPNGIGSTWIWPCPFHKEKTIGGFHVYSTGFKCYSCGRHGDIYDWWVFWRDKPLSDVLMADGLNINDITKRTSENAARIEKELSHKISEAKRALEELQSTRKWEIYHSALTAHAREMYKKRGIPEWYQDWRKFGFCPNFKVWYNGADYFTPSLTIPMFLTGWTCINIRHRLINPPDNTPGNKYRPERSGLGTQLFLANPDKSSNHEYKLIVEGEFKASVCYVTLGSDKWQVVGLPGKNAKSDIAEQIKGGLSVVCLDPDATKEAITLAKKIGGRMFALPEKIDDMIIANKITQIDLKNLIRSANKV